MSSSFSINCDWLPGDAGDASEPSAIAEIAIRVGGYCATEVEDVFDKTIRPARLSAYKLSEWLAFNWWRLLWEPEYDSYSWEASHKVGNVGGGCVWPNLSFSSDWQFILVSAHPTERWDAEPVRYLNRFDELPVPIADFEGAASGFIEATIERLSGAGCPKSELRALWDEVSAERMDAETANRRILEACMGYDPDEAPVDLLDVVSERVIPYGEGAIREIAAERKDETVSYINRVLESVGKKDAMTARLPNLADIRARLASQPAESNVPWIRAERTAQIARETWGLGSPTPTSVLCDLLSIRQDDYFLDVSPNGKIPLIAGVRDADDSDAFRISMNAKHPRARRFGLARLMADHIAADSEDALLPATRSKTERQKFQRAFAQELLCPFDALNGYLGYPDAETVGEDDIHGAADYFDVSPRLVHTALVNKGVLSRESLP